MKYFVFTLILTFIILLPLAFSVPLLFNPFPKNGTFILGRDTDIFSINITEEDLNLSSVKINYKVEGPAKWDNTTLNCMNTSIQDWFCNTTIQGLESLLADGKYLLYYFEASDNLGNYGYNGTIEDPLKVLVDRSKPIITPLNFQNMSYISLNKKPKVNITDKYSGVNISEAYWFYGNETWNSSLKKLDYNISFLADWDSSLLENNSSWSFYVSAKDNIGNVNVSKLAVLLVDNEYPNIQIISPSQNQKVYGTIELKVNVSDLYSGISKVSFEVASLSDSLSCESLCSYNLDTTQLEDGNNTIIFFVSDNANNINNKSVTIEVNNTFPFLELITPKKDYVSSVVMINISVKNVREIKESKIKFERFGFVGEWINMSCENFFCFYEWNTTQEMEDEYLIEIRIINEVGYEAALTFNLVVDNTKPILTILSPEGEVSGNVSLEIVATDENGLEIEATKYTISNYSDFMECNSFVQGKKIICSEEFDTTKLENGEYTVYFYVRDFAGNEENLTKTIKINNLFFAEQENVTENVTEEISFPEEAEITENITNITKPSLTQTIERFYSQATNFLSSFYFLPLLLLLLPILFILFYFKKKKVVIKDEIIKKLEEEKNSLEMIKSYLLSASKADNKLLLKEFVQNVNIFVKNIGEISIIRNEFNEILSSLSPALRLLLSEKYGKRIEEIEKREDLKKAKELIKEILISDDLNEMKEKCVKLIQIFEEFRINLEKEIAVWKEFIKDYKNLVLGK